MPFLGLTTRVVYICMEIVLSYAYTNVGVRKSFAFYSETYCILQKINSEDADEDDIDLHNEKWRAMKL